jgi:hypothetical protein
LKLCLKLNRRQQHSKKDKPWESSRLSLTAAGSSTYTALGGESAGGIGTPEFELTHSGGGPCAFVAIQSGGKAGGVTASKFSLNVDRSQHPGHGSGVGVGPATVGFSTPLKEPSTDANWAWPIESDERITLTTAMLPAMKKNNHKIRRNCNRAAMRFRLMIIIF